MTVVLEMRGAGGAQVAALWNSCGDWAEMRVLQWFRGVCPQKLKNGRFVRFLKLENR